MNAPVPLPGWTLPGVMTTGALQTLVRTQRVCPGDRVLIAGNGPLNLQLACELLAAGVRPVAVVEAAPRPGPVAWRDRLAHVARPRRTWCARAWGCSRGCGGPACRSCGVRKSPRWRATAACSRRRIGDRVIAADVVALNLGFQPEVGLARALGLSASLRRSRHRPSGDRHGRRRPLLGSV